MSGETRTSMPREAIFILSKTKKKKKKETTEKKTKKNERERKRDRERELGEKEKHVQSVLSGRTFKKIYPESVRVPSLVVKIAGPLLIVPCNYFMPVTGNSARRTVGRRVKIRRKKLRCIVHPNLLCNAVK